MDKIKVKCIRDSGEIFLEGKIYEAFWDGGDGYHEPKVLLTTDEYGNQNHIIAEHSLDDKWFKENFEVVE